MAMPLDKIYTAVLDFAGLSVNDQGYVQISFGDKSSNVIIDGKDLVFPTQEHLRNPQKNTTVFHPLSENEIGNESPVMKRLRELTYFRFNMITYAIMRDLISILNSPEIHKSLTGEAREILYREISMNKGSANALAAIVKTRKDDMERLFVTAWPRRGASVRGKTYYRAGIVNFDMYTKLASDEFLSNLPKGVRKDDPEQFRRLLKYIFPMIDDPSAYYEGSESRVAPFFESYLKTALRVASDLQSVLSTFEGHLDEAAEYSFNTEWVEIIDKLDELRGQIALIPVQNSIVPTSIPGIQPQPQQQVATGAVDLAAVMAAMGGQSMIPEPPKLSSGKRSITELANNNATFAARTLMNNAKLQSSQNPLQALMGLGNNGNAMNAMQLMAAMQQQNNEQAKLVQQLGADGAAKAQILMASGMSLQQAAMKVLAEKSNTPSPEQILAQLLGQSNQQANPLALAAQLQQGLGGLTANAGGAVQAIPGKNVPVGYPSGILTIENGQQFVTFTGNNGLPAKIPVVWQ